MTACGWREQNLYYKKVPGQVKQLSRKAVSERGFDLFDAHYGDSVEIYIQRSDNGHDNLLFSSQKMPRGRNNLTLLAVNKKMTICRHSHIPSNGTSRHRLFTAAQFQCQRDRQIRAHHRRRANLQSAILQSANTDLENQ